LSFNFEDYYYTISNGQLDYQSSVTTTDSDVLIDEIKRGNPSGYDIVLLPSNSWTNVPYNLDSPIVQNSFVFASDVVTLYSNVDVTNGLPRVLKGTIAIGDPKKDPYGHAAAQILDNVPGIGNVNDSKKITIWSNETVAAAAVDNGTDTYAFVANSELCRRSGNQTYYPQRTDQPLYYHVYQPTDRHYPYSPIELRATTVAHKRTPAQEKEVAKLVDFLKLKGTDRALLNLQAYCLVPPPSR
jgi:ABC-type molybdate transport system substrate-binding protein